MHLYPALHHTKCGVIQFLWLCQTRHTFPFKHLHLYPALYYTKWCVTLFCMIRPKSASRLCTARTCILLLTTSKGALKHVANMPTERPTPKDLHAWLYVCNRLESVHVCKLLHKWGTILSQVALSPSFEHPCRKFLFFMPPPFSFLYLFDRPLQGYVSLNTWTTGLLEHVLHFAARLISHLCYFVLHSVLHFVARLISHFCWICATLRSTTDLTFFWIGLNQLNCTGQARNIFSQLRWATGSWRWCRPMRVCRTMIKANYIMPRLIIQAN